MPNVISTLARLCLHSQRDNQQAAWYDGVRKIRTGRNHTWRYKKLCADENKNALNKIFCVFKSLLINICRPCEDKLVMVKLKRMRS